MNAAPQRNIVLIGMPGAGKSTIGPCLSKRLGMAYADLDDIIRERLGRELRDFVAERGYERFLEIQEQTVISLNLAGHVLATGGSVVMSPLSMRHLRESGRVIYLEVDFDTVEKRLAPGRRLARNGGQSLGDVYEERTPLYSRYADITVKCSGRSVEAIVGDILSEISKSKRMQSSESE